MLLELPAISIKALTFRFAMVFMPAVVLLSATLWSLISSYEENRVAIIEAREEGYLDVSTRLITSEFLKSISDLRTLSRVPILKRYLDDGSANSKQALEHLFRIQAEGSLRYDQIRILDINGRETIRVNYMNGRSYLVPESQLQDKSGRYYFRDAVNLEEGEVYVSPIDLNIEGGQIEQPLKPMVRFATPLFDSNGVRKGVLVLNYLGDILLRAFQEDMAKEPIHQAMLLNKDGYWLSHPDSAKEWGFMFGREELSFSRQFPNAWQQMSHMEHGRVETDKGIILFNRVYPLQDASDNHGDYYWKVAIVLPRETLEANALVNQPYGRVLLLALYFLLALLILVTSYFVVQSRQQRKNEQDTAREIEDLYNYAPCGYHSLNHKGMIVKMNQTELDWLGYRADELIGKVYYPQLLTPESQAVFKDHFPVFLRQGYISDMEFDLIRKDGSLMPVMVSATAIKDSDDQFVMSRSTVFDMTERKHLEEQLREQATTDFLTGLNNRRHFSEKTKKELARARRMEKALSFMILDLDHFKELNDTYGHDAGDIALKTFAQICTDTLREFDILGRLGGEEFAVLLPETDSRSAIEVAERLCKIVANTPISISDNKKLHITVSIGVTSCDPADSQMQDLLRRADDALYRAKNNGRNQVCYEASSRLTSQENSQLSS